METFEERQAAYERKKETELLRNAKLQESYQLELWQILRYNHSKVTINIQFSPDLGAQMYTIEVFVNGERVLINMGIHLWKRYKKAIDKLKNISELKTV